MIIERYLPHGGINNHPKLIVIHAMGEYVLYEGEYLYAPDFLDKIKLSAHSLITPEGENIRCRKDHETAYHAREHNQDSLGIEILVPGKHDYSSFLETMKTDYVTNLAWQATLEQVREWEDLHVITEITMHKTLDPGRKVDPGKGFNFERFIQEI